MNSIVSLFNQGGWSSVKRAFEDGRLSMPYPTVVSWAKIELERELKAALTRARNDRDELELVDSLREDLVDLKSWKPSCRATAAGEPTEEPNFISDSDFESHLGFETPKVDFAIRVDPSKLGEADPVVKEFLDDHDEIALLRLVRDEERLLARFDKEGHELVVHEIARRLGPDSPELDDLLAQRPFTLVLQNGELNCALHYLAKNGVDLFGRVPFRYLLVRNRNGATPLHFLAANPLLHERVLALPSEALQLQTKKGMSVQDVANYEKHVDVLKQVNARVRLKAYRSPKNQATGRAALERETDDHFSVEFDGDRYFFEKTEETNAGTFWRSKGADDPNHHLVILRGWSNWVTIASWSREKNANEPRARVETDGTLKGLKSTIIHAFERLPVWRLRRCRA
jgi:hypothetical protein